MMSPCLTWKDVIYNIILHIVFQIQINYVIVEISRRLAYNTKPVLEKEVPKVLRTICDEDNFRETEFSPSKVRAACKQLLSKLLTFFRYMYKSAWIFYW